MDIPSPHESTAGGRAALQEASTDARFPAPALFPRRPGNRDRWATASLILAVLAPFSILITIWPALITLWLTSVDRLPLDPLWLAMLVFWSIPGILGTISARLAICVIRGSPEVTQSRASAVAALWISGAVFTVACGPTLAVLGLF